MERLEDELTRKKVNIFTDIGHRMKRRPFSLQSGKGGGQEGLRSSFAPRSVLYQPEQYKFVNSEVNANDIPYHPNSLSKALPNFMRKELPAEETGIGSSRASSISRKSTRKSSESVAEKDSATVPIFKQKEKTNVSPHTFTAPLPKVPPGKSNAWINDALRPFPMDSWEIKTVHHPDVQSSSPNMGSKRVSDHGDGECGRKIKCSKEDEPSRNLTKLIVGDEDYSDEDSFEIDQAVDPSTLCPYCDVPLPLNPMSQLKNLLAIAKQQSHADPRPRNPFGLKAPLGIYISACQRHHFETHSLPEALEKGWPQYIDFNEVPKRVESMKSVLEDIIADADNCSDNESSVCDDTGGPRARSIFWRELQNEIKNQGSRTATSMKGQFSTFEKTQPGYYGELGLSIIHQTLYDLFPLSSFDTSLIAPLSPEEFVQLVLVPEVAVRLIMQDLHLDRNEAIKTLRESSQYGVGMFADIDSGSAVDNDHGNYESVADRIVMERAKARRLELEEEERIEERMWNE